MNDPAEIASALRANYALIVEAQTEVERYLSKDIELAELVERLIRILDGPAAQGERACG